MKEYEEAYEKFKTTELAYQDAYKALESGEFLRYIKNIEEWFDFWAALREKMTARNSALTNLKHSLRKEIQTVAGEVRGVDAPTKNLRVGEFSVTSATSRSLDPTKLAEECSRRGFWDEFRDTKVIDENGKEKHLFEYVPTVDYKAAMNWLKSKGYDDVIKVAYVETDRTPMVKGPKEVAFMGDTAKE